MTDEATSLDASFFLREFAAPSQVLHRTQLKLFPLSTSSTGSILVSHATPPTPLNSLIIKDPRRRRPLSQFGRGSHPPGSSLSFFLRQGTYNFPKLLHSSCSDFGPFLIHSLQRKTHLCQGYVTPFSFPFPFSPPVSLSRGSSQPSPPTLLLLPSRRLFLEQLPFIFFVGLIG